MEFQKLVANGDLEKAEAKLSHNKRMQKDRNRLLFLMNMGFVNHMQQEYAVSNMYFNEADLLIEDYKKSYGAEALALVSNPEVKPYRAEDFESVMIHYYKSVNFLKLADYEASIVEAKRMNLVLNRLNDKYKDHKNRYQADAFAHILMGLSYEASGKINDAFIAYRNAVEVYRGEHGYFDIPIPNQLKTDLLRTAYILGFGNELQFYEREFDMTYQHQPTPFGEAVVIWQNGMGPVKDEVSFNFIAVPGSGSYVIFENEQLGLTFPFYVGDDKQKRDDLLALHVVRVAFPKYLERPTYFTNAFVAANGKEFTLELAQDINAIAFKTLNDRFIREMGISLLRLGLKKVAEIKLGQENAALGAAATITNAISEKADTRNWQTLPHSIYYTRIPLKEGSNALKLNMKNKRNTTDYTTFEVEGDERVRLHFLPYHSIEHLPAAPWDNAASIMTSSN